MGKRVGRSIFLSVLFLCLFLLRMPGAAVYAEKVDDTQVDFKIWRAADESVVLCWNDIEGAVDYKVECYLKSPDSEVYDYEWSYGSEAVFTWLPAGEDLYFVLYAYRYAKNGDYEVIYTSNPVTTFLRAAAPESYSCRSVGALTVMLSWEPVFDEIAGYRIYRSADGINYSKVMTIKDQLETSAYCTVPYAGKDYYFKVCAYTYKERIINGEMTKAVKVSTKPEKQVLDVIPNQSSSLLLTWQRGEAGVSGYRIYRASSKDGSYKSIKTITDPTITFYVDENRVFDQYYYYKVRSYTEKTKDESRLYGYYSLPTHCRVKLGTPDITSIRLSTATKVTISWTPITGAMGYQIYQADEEGGSFRRVRTVTGQGTNETYVDNLVNGETYYFKVRAYKTIDGTKYYSNFSAVNSKLMYLLGYRDEPLSSKERRIYGSDGSKTYRTSVEASSHQKSITVKVWNLDANGNKYSSSRTIMVNAALAETYIQIFKEIYEGPEKFPIKDLGGYAWRGNGSRSEHCLGTAVDINWNENYMISKISGKILAGSLYQPGINPYSIPAGGDVVRTFEKYGFAWGNWSTKIDYMHFSYFGT